MREVPLLKKLVPEELKYHNNDEDEIHCPLPKDNGAPIIVQEPKYGVGDQ